MQNQPVYLHTSSIIQNNDAISLPPPPSNPWLIPTTTSGFWKQPCYCYLTSYRFFYVAIPAWVESGLVVGLASGTFDLLHAGHLMFLQACRDQCDVLVVGVDENQMVRRYKGQDRPCCDFPVRVGTLSELGYINSLFRIPEIGSGFGPHTVFPYNVSCDPELSGDPETLAEIKHLLRQSSPEWYDRIGPNLRLFWTAGDPAADVKKGGIELLGGRGVVIPPHAHTLSSTGIIRHFGVQQPDGLQNRFGIDPLWIRNYTQLGKEFAELSA